MRGWDSDGTSWTSWIAMILFMAAFWGLAAWVVVSVARRSDDTRDPMELLEERFARGEIGADEFEQRRDILAHSR